MRLKWLKALEAKAEAGDEEALGLLSSEALSLAKQSEDRAHGTPRQSVEHSGQGENGEIVFKTVYQTKDG